MSIIYYNDINFDIFPFTENDLKYYETYKLNPNKSFENISESVFKKQAFSRYLCARDLKYFNIVAQKINPPVKILFFEGGKIHYIVLTMSWISQTTCRRHNYDMCFPFILLKDYYMPDLSEAALNTPLPSDIIRNV